MIKLQYPEKVHLEKYDVDVKPYLTLEEIGVCINAMTQCDSYLSKVAAFDGCLLNFCVSDIELDGTQYDVMLASGFMEAVRNTVKDVDYVWQCVAHEESVARSANEFIKELVNLINKASENMPDVETSKEMLATLTSQIDKLQGVK